MTKKNIRVLFAAYVLLAAAASAPFWYGKLADKMGWHQESPIAFADFGPDAEKFSMSSNGQALAFERLDGTWQVNGKPADQDAVRTFFDVLKTTTTGRIASRNRDNRAVYGVDETSGYALHLEQGGKTLDVIVGKAIPGGTAYYLRKTSDDTVYEASGSLRQLVTRPESNWIPDPAKEESSVVQSVP